MIRKLLRDRKARFKGVDRQTDTYFRVKTGRLKLREGNIENCLVYYRRADQPGPKPSHVILYPTPRRSPLKTVLTAAMGVSSVVEKRREIYFLGNVKFHIDRVRQLGSFVEIEAIDRDGRLGRKKLLAQCRHYLKLFGIRKKDLICGSYSDMLAT